MWFQQMHPAWQQALAGQRPLLDRLELQLATQPGLAPRADLVMAAFTSEPAEVRVLILGQDPYPTPGVAVGRAFAVSGGSLPGSLRNIFRELASDIEPGPLDGNPEPDLMGWQRQGVLLLNRHLTTIEGQSGAHFDAGWEAFTDAAISYLLHRPQHLVLVLWGAHAHKVGAQLGGQIGPGAPQPTVIEGVHPSPLSANRGFFGSRPFSAINRALEAHGQMPIDWFS